MKEQMFLISESNAMTIAKYINGSNLPHLEVVKIVQILMNLEPLITDEESNIIEPESSEEK